MLTQEEIKIAVVMIGRANCTGQEAKSVATLLDKLVAIHNAIDNAQNVEQEEVDDTATD